MSRYHAASVAFDKEAGVAEIVEQLSKLLGAGSKALSDAAAAVGKLGLGAVKKLLNILKRAVAGMATGTKARFAAAVFAVALASGAAKAGEIVVSVTQFGAGISYVDYRRSPAVVHLYDAGLLESDIVGIYEYYSSGYRGYGRRYDRGYYDRGYYNRYDRGYRYDRGRDHDIKDVIKDDIAHGIGEGIRDTIRDTFNRRDRGRYAPPQETRRRTTPRQLRQRGPQETRQLRQRTREDAPRQLRQRGPQETRQLRQRTREDAPRQLRQRGPQETRRRQLRRQRTPQQKTRQEAPRRRRN